MVAWRRELCSPVIVLFVVILVGGYALAANWAARHGQGQLWLTAAATLLLIALGSVLLGRYYAVPSTRRLLLYTMALAGPIVFVPTAMLSFATAVRSTLATALPTAILGACLGLVCGFVIVVFGLRVW